MKLDYEQASRELLRALRGDRSQVALARRLGYASNVVYTWESGRRWPSATELFRLAGLVHRDARGALAGWYRTPPPWLERVDLTTAAGVARLLQHEQGDTPIVTIAERSGFNRYSVARWLRGTATPRLPELLRLLDATSMRVVDLLAVWVGPEAAPSIAPLWETRESRRNAAITEPWSQAVLRALELPAMQPAELGPRLKIPDETVARAIEVLLAAGQVRRVDGRLEPVVTEALDTRRDAASARRLKGFWAQVGHARLEAGEPGEFAYNLFSVSHAQLERLREMHHAYWRAVRAVVAEDEPAEVVALLNLQLLRLA